MRFEQAALAASALYAVSAMSAFAGEAQSQASYGTPTIGLFQECGMLQSGRFSAAGPFHDEWVDHFGAFFIERASLGERLDIEVGLGGVFEYQKPEIISAGWGGSQYRNFFLGPSRATLSWRGGDPDHPWITATAGMFSHKYNPDAANLGEYLFRANPYPGYLLTGGYAIVGASDAYLQGAKAEMAFGNLGVTLMAVTETGFPPLYDLSLAALVRYATTDGSLEVGAGINAKRILPVRPSRTEPQSARNSYFRKGDTWYTGNTFFYRSRVDFAASRHDAVDSRSEEHTSELQSQR